MVFKEEMKSVFVVLLPLFIGFNSGVIAPSDAKAINKTLSETNRDDLQKNMTDLEKSNRTDESELFQTPGKESTLNERSFIFINRRRSQALRNKQPSYHLNKPFRISERSPQVNAIPANSVQNGNSPKQLFTPNVWKMGVNPWYVPPKYNHLGRDHKSWYNDYMYAMKRVANNQIYPILRPFNIKPQNYYERLNNFTTMQPKNLSHTSFNKVSCDRHTKNFISNAATPYDSAPNSAFQIRDRPFIMPERIFARDNIEPDVSNWNEDNDNILERYINETLQDFFRNSTEFDSP